MNVKETFLKLTEYTHPFKTEHELLPLLPKGMIEDEVGNYFITIGQSDTLFTCHLDTYCKEKVKVEHVIQGNKISIPTGSTYTLGADDQAGVCIMMYMIEQNVPGTYYFFIGEESFSGGRWGSLGIFQKRRSFFSKFKRCISFDRRGYGSVITRQSARTTCSNDFSKALIEELGKAGMEYKVDITGYYTDSATFLDVIPEVTNLSTGGFNEHTSFEYIDIDYLEKVCEAASKVDWEKLPTIRVAKPVTTSDYGIMQYVVKSDYKKTRKMYHQVITHLTGLGFKCLNYQDFKPGKEMIFSQWHQDLEIKVRVYTEFFTIDGVRMSTKDEIYNYFGLKEKDDVDLVELFDEICGFIEFELGEGEFDVRDEYIIDDKAFAEICTNIGTDAAIIRHIIKEISFLELRGPKMIFKPSKF